MQTLKKKKKILFKPNLLSQHETEERKGSKGAESCGQHRLGRRRHAGRGCRLPPPAPKRRPRRPSGPLRGWAARSQAGLRGEEPPGWGRRGRVQEAAARRAPRPAGCRDPGSPPPPFPQTPALRVPGGREPRRRGAGWPWAAAGSAGRRRAAAGRTRVDAKAGGAARLPRTAAPGPEPGRGTANRAAPPASRKEEPPPVGSLSLFSRENPSPGPCHPVSGWGTRVRASRERLSARAGASPASLFIKAPGREARKRPLGSGKATSGKQEGRFSVHKPTQGSLCPPPRAPPRACSLVWAVVHGDSCLPPTPKCKLGQTCTSGCWEATKLIFPKSCFYPKTSMPLGSKRFIIFGQNKPSRAPNETVLTVG